MKKSILILLLILSSFPLMSYYCSDHSNKEYNELESSLHKCNSEKAELYNIVDSLKSLITETLKSVPNSKDTIIPKVDTTKQERKIPKTNEDINSIIKDPFLKKYSFARVINLEYDFYLVLAAKKYGNPEIFICTKFYNLKDNSSVNIFTKSNKDISNFIDITNIYSNFFNIDKIEDKKSLVLNDSFLKKYNFVKVIPLDRKSYFFKYDDEDVDQFFFVFALNKKNKYDTFICTKAKAINGNETKLLFIKSNKNIAYFAKYLVLRSRYSDTFDDIANEFAHDRVEIEEKWHDDDY